MLASTGQAILLWLFWISHALAASSDDEWEGGPLILEDVLGYRRESHLLLPVQHGVAAQTQNPAPPAPLDWHTSFQDHQAYHPLLWQVPHTPAESPRLSEPELISMLQEHHDSSFPEPEQESHVLESASRPPSWSSGPRIVESQHRPPSREPQSSTRRKSAMRPQADSLSDAASSTEVSTSRASHAVRTAPQQAGRSTARQQWTAQHRLPERLPPLPFMLGKSSDRIVAENAIRIWAQRKKVGTPEQLADPAALSSNGDHWALEHLQYLDRWGLPMSPGREKYQQVSEIVDTVSMYVKNINAAVQETQAELNNDIIKAGGILSFGKSHNFHQWVLHQATVPIGMTVDAAFSQQRRPARLKLMAKILQADAENEKKVALDNDWERVVARNLVRDWAHALKEVNLKRIPKKHEVSAVLFGEH